MKKISDSDLSHLAGLVNLSIGIDEDKKYVDQLGEVLGYVSQLQEMDLDKVEETNQVTGLTNVVADDVVEEGLDRNEVLDQSAESKDGYVLVEAVLPENNDA